MMPQKFCGAGKREKMFMTEAPRGDLSDLCISIGTQGRWLRREIFWLKADRI